MKCRWGNQEADEMRGGIRLLKHLMVDGHHSFVLVILFCVLLFSLFFSCFPLVSFHALTIVQNACETVYEIISWFTLTHTYIHRHTHPAIQQKRTHTTFAWDEHQPQSDCLTNELTKTFRIVNRIYETHRTIEYREQAHKAQSESVCWAKYHINVLYSRMVCLWYRIAFANTFILLCAVNGSFVPKGY